MQHQFIKSATEVSLEPSRLEEIRNSAKSGSPSDCAAQLPPKLSSAWIESQGMIANPSRGSRESQGLMTKPPCVRLNIEDLKSFETVERQFYPWGVQLNNAIALHPSNEAYPPRSGKIVLIGAPKSGWMEIIFKRPVRFFNCYVTSSQRVALLGYDRRDRVLTQAEISEPNLANSGSQISPNAQLSAITQDSGIARVTLYAFDGQLTVDDLSFGF